MSSSSFEPFIIACLSTIRICELGAGAACEAPSKARVPTVPSMTAAPNKCEDACNFFIARTPGNFVTRQMPCQAWRRQGGARHSERHQPPDRFPFHHKLERVIDHFERYAVRDHFV